MTEPNIFADIDLGERRYHWVEALETTSRALAAKLNNDHCVIITETIRPELDVLIAVLKSSEEG